MKSLHFPPYSKSSNECKYATGKAIRLCGPNFTRFE
ncbi:unnamed protein product [Larinioides sclopetarius]|uniref:Uncharacterized protein n=1 Tax=Larinioides sclopetarius TaxID=280406 RepID=A0AAV2AFH0_9ARAC